MNCTAQNLVANAQNLATMPTPPGAASFEQPPKLGALGSLRVHWPEYLMEAGLLGAFMVSACIFGALYEFPHSPVRQAITSQLFRRMLMGISMGLTAIAIIYSPWGKQSGAHINPSVTFTFFRLGKVKLGDAIFYIAAQFTGAVLGVRCIAHFLSKEISDPAVRYVVTVPGPHGPWVALLAEFIIAFGLMSTVLYFSNHHRLDRYTGLFAGFLAAHYNTKESWLDKDGKELHPHTNYYVGSLAPSDPQYRGRYTGGPAERDGAYHQGTVWPWLMGPFITAYVKVNGDSEAARRQAAAWLAPLKDHLADGGLGHISEILDGDSPQRPCGCIAQAWSVAEILRALVEDVYGLRPMPQQQVPAAQARAATAVRTAVSRQTGMRTGANP